MTSDPHMRVAFVIHAPVRVTHADGCEITYPEHEDVDVNTVFDHHRALHSHPSDITSTSAAVGGISSTPEMRDHAVSDR